MPRYGLLIPCRRGDLDEKVGRHRLCETEDQLLAWRKLLGNFAGLDIAMIDRGDAFG